MIASCLFTSLIFSFSFLPLHDPQWQNEDRLLHSPSRQFWLGTDSLGRDLFSRLLSGGRLSIAIATSTALSSLIVGGLYGTLAATISSGRFLMVLLDLIYSVPSLLFLLLVSMAFGEGFVGIFLALTLEGAITVARLVRSKLLELRNADFIRAAAALGASRTRILLTHCFPNLWGPLMVCVLFLVPNNMLYEAFLSFLGLGVQPPQSSWGMLANEGWRGILNHPLLILAPCLAMFLTVLAFQLCARGLEQWSLQKRRL